MKDSEVLIEARKLIRSGGVKFICTAIQHSSFSDGQVDALKEWIRSMLGGVYVLETWLNEQLRFVEGGRDCCDSPHLVKDVRIRWLDWMIAYCQAEEALQETTNSDNM